MSCYFIAQIRIHDQEEYGKYLAGVDDVFAKYKGEYLVVDDNPAVLEGEWPFTRIVVIRFPNEEELQRWYHSPEYQEILQHRLRAAQCSAIVAKGR